MLLLVAALTGTDHCGFTGCIDYNEDPLGWDGLGLGRILLFLFIDGIVFFTVIVLVELQTWNKIKYYFQRQRHPHQGWKFLDFFFFADFHILSCPSLSFLF